MRFNVPALVAGESRLVKAALAPRSVTFAPAPIAASARPEAIERRGGALESSTNQVPPLSVPLPTWATGPLKVSVPELTATVPVLSRLAEIVAVPAPPTLHNRPILVSVLAPPGSLA